MSNQMYCVEYDSADDSDFTLSDSDQEEMRGQSTDAAPAVSSRQSRPKRAAFLKAEEFIRNEIQAIANKKAAALQQKLKVSQTGAVVDAKGDGKGAGGAK